MTTTPEAGGGAAPQPPPPGPPPPPPGRGEGGFVPRPPRPPAPRPRGAGGAPRPPPVQRRRAPAAGPARTSVVVVAGRGRLFAPGRDGGRAGTGGGVDRGRLGGRGAPSRRSGVVPLVTETDAEALDRARQVAALFSDQGKIAEDAEDRDLSGVLPDSPRRAYDVHLLTGKLLDSPGVELHPRWAPNIVTILGRLAGRTVGVVASNPMRLGGCLDAAAAEKAARFVWICDAFGVPLVVLWRGPGY